MRRAAVVAIFGVLGVVGVASAPAAQQRSACTAGVHKFGDVQARTFCGPAKATVVFGGKTIGFSGGVCERGPAYVAVNIGTVVLGQTKKRKPEYFGLIVGKAPIIGGTPASRDGTYKAQAVTFAHAGKGVAVFSGMVTLAGGRKRGTFTGKTFGDNKPVKGTFTC